MGGRRIFKIIAVVLVVVALFILLGSVLKRQASGAWPMHDDYDKRRQASYIVPESQYSFPYDANRTGQIALKIDDPNLFVQEVRSVATKENGEISFYELNNATSEARNGIVVIKIRDDRFEEVFAQLKNRGNLVVQESFNKESDIRITCPMVATEKEAIPLQEEKTTELADKQESGDAAQKDAVSEGAVAVPDLINTNYPCVRGEDNFSYIKVVFMADKREGRFWGSNSEQYFASMAFERMGNWILVVMVIKIAVTLFVIACLILLIVQFLRHTIFHHHRVRSHHVEEDKKVKTKPLRKENKVAVKRRSVVLKSKGKK